MPSYNYPAGTVIEIDGTPCDPPKETMPGRLFLMDRRTGQPFIVHDGEGGTTLPSHADYDRLITDGRLEVKMPPNVIASRALLAKAEWDVSDCEAIDPDVRKNLAQCEVLDQNGVKNGIAAVTAGLAKHWTPDLVEKYGPHDNPHTIKRRRAERGTAGNRTHKDMVRLNGRTQRDTGLSDAAMEIRQKHAIDGTGNYGAVKAAYAMAVTELIAVNEGRHDCYPQPEEPYPIFSYETFRRACVALSGSETTGTRDGDEMVEARMRGAGKPLTASRILEKVIIDHTQLSCFTVVEPERYIVAGKPWLTLAIDVHSRAVLAWIITFRPPSYWTVCEILRRMNLPKRPPPNFALRYPFLPRICGKPGELILDNASEFTGHGLEDAAKCGSFSVRFCPIKQPRYRAIVERSLGTVERKMLEHLPGASMTIEYNRLTGHDGEDLAVVTPNELEALANHGIAEYHTEPHDGLQGRQPALVFQKSANRHGIDVMHDVRRFQLETYEVRQNVKVTKSGVRAFGLRFHCPIGVPRLIDNNLRYEPRRQRRADATIHTKIKFDPENIATVHAWDRTTNSYVEMKCADETYADGMPLWFHEELLEIARKEATAPAKDSARKRAYKRAEPKAEPTIRPLSELDDTEGTGVVGFNTEAERMEARARRIAAIRAIAPRARHRERLVVARLYETPRLRQITGNIVHLDTDYAEAVTTDDFIAHDVSALTALDAEIEAPRTEVEPRRKERTGRGDRRDAGKNRPGIDQPDDAAASARRRPSSRLAG